MLLADNLINTMGLYTQSKTIGRFIKFPSQLPQNISNALKKLFIYYQELKR